MYLEDCIQKARAACLVNPDAKYVFVLGANPLKGAFAIWFHKTTEEENRMLVEELHDGPKTWTVRTEYPYRWQDWAWQDDTWNIYEEDEYINLVKKANYDISPVRD